MVPVCTDDDDCTYSSVLTNDSDRPNSFWHRPSSCELEQQANEYDREGGLLSVNNQKNVQFGGGGGQQLWQPKALSDGSKRRQAKMLLVSLIESFCRVYGESPESNRKVFFLICQTLRSLGLIDAEFMDEMASVRSTFQNAFQQLFYTAVQTVQDERLFQQHQKMIGPVPSSSSDEEEGSSMRRFQTPPPQPSAAAATPSPITSEQLLSNLSVQNSRYENDFVEISMLGRGGFASVWRARNKLDGIDYAIKKIRLGKDLDTMMDHENPYEKIFREIKHLARLEHRNVVRYYSSWLELVSSAALQRDEEEDEDYFSEYYRSSTTATTTRKSKVRFHQETSMFNDPIFDFSDESSLRMNASQLSSPGIDFVMEEETEEEEEKMTLTRGGGGGSTSNSSSMMEVQRSSSIQRRHHHHHRSAFGSFEGEWVLYIQMQLCPATLHDFIKFRNQQCFKDNEDGYDAVDPQRNIDIFAQILEGAAYIHEQGVMHRDLKPTNIFLNMPASLSESRRSSQGNRRHGRSRANSLATLGGPRSHGSISSSNSSSNHGMLSSSSSLAHDHSFSFDSVHTPDGLRQCMWDEPWVPKIGDFGLAAASEEDQDLSSSSPFVEEDQQSASENNSSSKEVSENTTPRRRPSVRRMRTGGVGTRTYASPEQLAHRPSAYGEKVDIYSLAIIFFELYRPFATAMERAEAIDALKQGIFPDGFVERYPKESALILWMMDPNAANRPTAAQLLDFELFTGDSTNTQHPQQQQQKQQQKQEQEEDHNDESFASLKSQLKAKSRALDQQNEEMAALRMRMERIEMEKKLEMDAMQKRLDDLQRQLEQVQHTKLPLTPPASTNMGHSSDTTTSTSTSQ